MSKAGKGDGVDSGAVGSQHPVPEDIPHLSSPVSNTQSSTITNGAGAGGAPKHAHHGSIAGVQAGSPIKEGSFLKSETSADDEQPSAAKDTNTPDPAAPAAGEGIPIRG